MVDQLAACYLLDHVDELLAERRQALRTQRDALVGSLARTLPSWDVPVPAGGMVLWCQLPHAMSSAIAAAAPAFGLALAAGPRFGTGHTFDDRLRLPFTHPAEVLERGVEMLAEVIAATLPAGRDDRGRARRRTWCEQSRNTAGRAGIAPGPPRVGDQSISIRP